MADMKSGAIVMVDDEEGMRNYLKEVLTLQGYTTIVFSEANAALCHLASTQDIVALVISDINMPGMSGVELLRTVKAVTPDLPFILLSGLYEKSIAIDAVRTGATDYL
jgi:DNA-binding NtrC family response regulator